MKKIIAFLMIFGSMSVFAADSYLYWMLDLSNTDPYIPKGGETPNLSAKIKQEGSSSYLNIYAGDGTEISSSGVLSYSTISSFAEYGIGYYAGAVTENKSFIIEIYAGDEKINFGDGGDPTLAYNAANIAAAGIGAPATMATVSVSLPIPEPNSGLLMLIGASVLALRRKKLQKKA